jgi:hypothetical protein
MIASYIGEHKRKIRITQMIGLVALYCFVFFFTYKFIIVPLKTEFFTNPEFKNGFYVEFTSYLITSTISFLLALTGSKYLIEKNK